MSWPRNLASQELSGDIPMLKTKLLTGERTNVEMYILPEVIQSYESWGLWPGFEIMQGLAQVKEVQLCMYTTLWDAKFVLRGLYLLEYDFADLSSIQMLFE